MTQLSFEDHCDRMPVYFRELMAGDAEQMKPKAAWKGLHAVYAFFEEGRACHVGRTRNLQSRIYGHLSKSHYSASFAFAETRRTLGKRATYRKGEGRKELFSQPWFREEFDSHSERIAQMTLRFATIPDPIDQTLFELFAALELGTPLDEFRTS